MHASKSSGETYAYCIVPASLSLTFGVNLWLRVPENGGTDSSVPISI